MANEVAKVGKSPITISGLVHNEEFVKKAQDTLGSKTQGFLTSVLTLSNSDAKFKECDAIELYNTCLKAAAMGLPFESNLGCAYIIPFKDHGVMRPQLQIGYKGFIQLAQRSGMFKTINVTEVKEGEIKSNNRLTGEIEFSWIEDEVEREKKKTIGYVAYIELLSGFSKMSYMSAPKAEAHARKYSQSYAKYGSGVWKDEFDAMAKKTVLKLLLKTYGPQSVEIQKAIELDQSDADGEYIDRKPIIEATEAELGESEESAMGKIQEVFGDVEPVTPQPSKVVTANKLGKSQDEINEAK